MHSFLLIESACNDFYVIKLSVYEVNYESTNNITIDGQLFGLKKRQYIKSKSMLNTTTMQHAKELALTEKVEEIRIQLK